MSFTDKLQSIKEYPKVIEVTRYEHSGDNEIIGILVDSEQKRNYLLEEYNKLVTDGDKDYWEFDEFINQNVTDAYQEMQQDQTFEPMLEKDIKIRDLQVVTPTFSQYREHFNFEEDKSLVSDGFHTFKELYQHRLILSALAFKKAKEKGYRIWKSYKHYGESEDCYGGDYFIVGVDLPEGQFSYHYEKGNEHLFNYAEHLEESPKWDGHTSKDVTRLLILLMD
jgi:hypothetical protein